MYFFTLDLFGIVWLSGTYFIPFETQTFHYPQIVKNAVLCGIVNKKAFLFMPDITFFPCKASYLIYFCCLIRKNNRLLLTGIPKARNH